MSLHELTATRNDGKEEGLDSYKGKVLLVVNTASQCGFTPQYKGLQELYTKHREKGFEVLGFPCDQFGHQEPGSDEEIHSFCERNFGVTFPLFKKIEVNGDNTHPVFEYLKKNAPGLLGQRIKWNFTKFLVDGQGKVIKRYAPTTTPEKIESDIKELLEAK
ncbi:glutathione peroxidase [Leptonema illini]|uniref:Glutathione peroxidase n=1 Tax=Leptonema illini DSM 21528 TaxID=929563 RepID=H2CDJ3_9LEPT|nr:glutathione peroxidase [Leptonema illini]EHQ06526.1 glutathione peroxidase [Leptonema illini DSM 21528]